MKPLQDCRVLIVEDEAGIALMLAEMLRDAGCTVIGPADRIESALGHAETETIDVAILDVNIAGQDVIPVADRLAARGTAFLFITGYDDTEQLGVHAKRPVLRKPFTEGELLAALHKARPRLP
jgi:DNA-binding response OmpR family regulator